MCICKDICKYIILEHIMNLPFSHEEDMLGGYASYYKILQDDVDVDLFSCMGQFSSHLFS